MIYESEISIFLDQDFLLWGEITVAQNFWDQGSESNKKFGIRDQIFGSQMGSQVNNIPCHGPVNNNADSNNTHWILSNKMTR